MGRRGGARWLHLKLLQVDRVEVGIVHSDQHLGGPPRDGPGAVGDEGEVLPAELGRAEGLHRSNHNDGCSVTST